MPLEDWAATKETLHRFLQIVGKTRFAPPSPQPLVERSLSPHGAGHDHSTDGCRPDFRHRLRLRRPSPGGDRRHREDGKLPLTEQSVASFDQSTLKLLGDLGIEVSIAYPEPFAPSNSTPFADDTSIGAYDPFWVNRYWRILSEVGLILEEFAGRFSGKTSPVHLFWHSMDIAVTRFSDRG